MPEQQKADTADSFSQRVAYAGQAIEATPSFERLVEDFGEENAKVDSDGNFEIRVDASKGGLLREAFQGRNRAQQRMAEVVPGAYRGIQPPTLSEVAESLTRTMPPGSRSAKRYARGERRPAAGMMWVVRNGRWVPE